MFEHPSRGMNAAFPPHPNNARNDVVAARWNRCVRVHFGAMRDAG
jgi:hypothetical protein